MAQNTQPIFTLVPNVGNVLIPTTNAQVKSDGTSAGSGADLMYKIFTSGANGSFIDRIRFFSVANTAATTGVATVLRAYLSTISSPGATSTSDTYLLGEVSVPAISSSNSVNATNYYEIVLGFTIPTGRYIHVSQHVAQTTNQAWMATALGGDY
jgi:hypothetical protein